MNPMTGLALVMVTFLLIYLSVALINPERFS